MARIFGGMIAWILLGALLRAAPAPAKELPRIAPGTTVEAVLRTHGRPKGQMNAGPRELWTYERFRVVFEHGRVVSVDPLDRASPINIVPDPNTSRGPVNPAAPAGAAPSGPIRFNVGTSTPEAAAPAAVVTPRPERVARTPAQRAAASGRSLLSKVMLGVLFVALAVAVGVVIWANAKQKAAEREGGDRRR